MSSDPSSSPVWSSIEHVIKGSLLYFLWLLVYHAVPLRRRYPRVPLEAPGGPASMPLGIYCSLHEWFRAVNLGVCPHCEAKDPGETTMTPIALSLHDDVGSVVAACARCGRCASARASGDDLAMLWRHLVPPDSDLAAVLEDGGYWRLGAPSRALVAVLTETTGAAARDLPPSPPTQGAVR